MGTTIINGNTKTIQGNGNVQLYCLNEDLLREDLKAINVSGSLSTILNIDPNCDEPQFFIKVEANIFPLLEIHNRNGNLEIGFKPNSSFSTNHNIECIIQAPSLKSLAVIGSGSVKGNYYGSKLITTLTGSGKIELYGNTEKLEASIQGSGTQNFKNLVSQDCTAQVMGSGDLSCFAIQSVNAKVIGSGSIKLAGTTLKINKDILGSGKIDLQQNYTAQTSPLNFKQLLKTFKEFDTENAENINHSKVSINKTGDISVSQYSQNGNNVLIIGDNYNSETPPVKESFFSKLKKFF